MSRVSLLFSVTLGGTVKAFVLQGSSGHATPKKCVTSLLRSAILYF